MNLYIITTKLFKIKCLLHQNRRLTQNIPSTPKFECYSYKELIASTFRYARFTARTKSPSCTQTCVSQRKYREAFHRIIYVIMYFRQSTKSVVEVYLVPREYSSIISESNTFYDQVICCYNTIFNMHTIKRVCNYKEATVIG